MDPLKPDYVKPKDINSILLEIGCTTEEYYDALKISTDNDFQIHFKRKPNSCFVNNYFTEGLMSWEANVDIQPVINHYKAVAYMCVYFPKSEEEAMKQVVKETVKENINVFQKMKAFSKAYTTKRECSVQEAVYHIMPDLWLQKTFLCVLFANSNLPEYMLQ